MKNNSEKNYRKYNLFSPDWNIYTMISTVMGIGFFPLRGGGSWAALVCVLFFILFKLLMIDLFNLSKELFFGLNVIFLFIFTFIGFFSIKKTTTIEDPDPHHIVIDEWVGMWIPLMFINYNYLNFVLILISFLIFRLFDIFKPWPINKFEKLPHAYGVLGDDIIAGIFTLFCMLIIIFLYPFI